MTQGAYWEDVWEMTGADGLVRRGVLTLPGRGTHPRVALILIPAGMTYRIAPGRLHVKIARRLAARLGLACLRLDTLGLGESEGEIESAPTRQLWGTIEAARFVDDTLLALKTMRARKVADRVVLSGLCGGATTAMIAATRAPEPVDGLLSMNAVSTRSDQPGQKPRTLTPGETRHRLKAYLREMSSPTAWQRLLKGESDFRAIGATLGSFAKWLTRRAPKNEESQANPLFAESFRTLLSRDIRHLMIFSSNTRHWHAFESMFYTPLLQRKPKTGACEVVVIPETNHEFYLPEWREALFRCIEDWFLRAFPAELSRLPDSSL